MKLEPTTIEAVEKATGRLTNGKYQLLLDMLKDGKPVRVSEVENSLSFGSAFRAAAKRAGILVSIYTDKNSDSTVYVVPKSEDEPEEDEVEGEE